MNGEELIAALHEHARVRWRVCGHVHLDQAIPGDGLTMLTTPSTCPQLSRVSQAAKALPGPPAFRIIDVSGDEPRQAGGRISDSICIAAESVLSVV